MDEAVEEGARGDDCGAGKKTAAIAELESEDAAVGTEVLFISPRPYGTGQIQRRLQPRVPPWAILGFSLLEKSIFEHEVDDFGLADV